MLQVVPQTYWVVHLLFGPHFSVQFNNTYQQYVHVILDVVSVGFVSPNLSSRHVATVRSG